MIHESVCLQVDASDFSRLRKCSLPVIALFFKLIFFYLVLIHRHLNQEMFKSRLLSSNFFLYVLYHEEKYYKNTVKTPKTQFSSEWFF